MCIPLQLFSIVPPSLILNCTNSLEKPEKKTHCVSKCQNLFILHVCASKKERHTPIYKYNKTNQLMLLQWSNYS